MLRVSCLVAAAFAIAAPIANASGTAQSNAGILLIGGSPSSNHISVFVSPTIPSQYYRVFDTSGMTPQSGCSGVDASDVDCAAFGVSEAVAFLQGGDDTFASNLQLPAAVLGEDGNDSIDGGPLNDSIAGNGGNDTLHGE